MEWLIAAALFAVLIFTMVVLLSRRYKRCSSNAVMVIYGKVGGRGAPAKCLHGGAAFIWPLIQDFQYLSLEPIQIDIPLSDALSMENIRVKVPSVFTVAIGTTPEVMQNASVRLLGLDQNHVKKQAEDIIFGQLRQVIASMKIDDINRDRDGFLHNIQNSLEPELKKIGLVLINVNIKDITDESGYIEAIGKKAASQAVQQARGDVAEQEKLGEIRVAEADRDKQVQVAEAERSRNIGIRAAQQEQAVRVAELEKQQIIGEQNAAFVREAEVKNAEREMRIRVADADATAIDGENTAQARVAASNADLQVRRAEAFQVGESRKAQAEAAVLEARNLALAKAALAEAEKIEAERRAQLEAPAKAEKAKTIVEAEAEAEKRRIEAEGEAKAIFARLEAEAKGNYEILAKKGEGLKQIVAACGGANEAFQLLMLEQLGMLAEQSAKAISNIKFDKVIVWENGGQNGTSNVANFLQNLAHTFPPMLQVLKEIGGVELPESLIKLVEQGAATDGKGNLTPSAEGGIAVAPLTPAKEAAPEKPVA
jgi:flotillin